MKTPEIKVIIKDRDGKILDKYHTAKVISNLKSEINPESQAKTLNYTIKGNHVFIPQSDLIVLKVKLEHFHQYALVETPA